MSRQPLYSPKPYFVLTALFALVPVLNTQFLLLFFPQVPSVVVDILSIVGGVFSAYRGMIFLWARLQARTEAKEWIRQTVGSRKAPEMMDSNDLVIAGRTINRLIQHMDEDLREIKPDFTIESLKRLGSYLPELLMEVEDEEGARIRLGIVGVYSGETLCRSNRWEWTFKSDPSLKQFSYLLSEIHRNEKRMDPFAVAAKALTEKIPMLQLLGDFQ